MDKSLIYILIVLVGVAVGIISLALRRKSKKEDLKDIFLEGNGGERIKIISNRIFIRNDVHLRNKDIEIRPIFNLEQDLPEINVFEDDVLIKTFIIEPRNENPNLNGQYFHSSIRVNSNSSVQIDGLLSESSTEVQKDAEGIRFQPFFLSDKEELNLSLRGKGMFQRGLHYSGIISSGNIRLICLCDECQKSFTVEFFHAGFSEVQYFYSSNSKETLIVSYNSELNNVPHQLQKKTDDNELKELESKLPRTSDGLFKYYNAFKCPHCNFDYINFRDNKEMRPNEYYGNYYINQEVRNI